MAGAAVQGAPSSARVPGWILLASGIAVLALLAMHPQGHAKDFAGVLQEQAAHRGIEAFVHGGFILILAIQTACYTIFSLRTTHAAHEVIAGLVLFCFGAALQCGSVLIDGFVLPAIAARYAAIPAKLETAQTLYVLGGTLISLLMPMGIAFQSAGIVMWSTCLLRTNRRAAGLAGLLIGISVLMLTIAGSSTMAPIMLMGGIAGLAVWAAIAGTTMLGTRT